MSTYQITVPPGMSAGQEVQFRTPAGMMSVRIPIGVRPGATFTVQVAAPSAPPPSSPAPMGSPVPMGLPVEMPADPTPPGVGLQPSFAESRSRHVAERYAECAISFEPLHSGPVGCFLDTQYKRVSNHYFSLEHARSWLASGNGMCPLTRKAIHSVLEVPNVERDPEGWFKAVDVDGSGSLSRSEAIEALKAQFAVDVAALDTAVTDENHWMWQQWDLDRSGFIEKEEMLAPTGLVSSVRQMFAAQPTNRGDGIPDVRRDKGAWYDYWDEDKSGYLEQDEVVRALLKTLKLSDSPSRVQEMRSTVTAVWPIFDPDGSGSIDRAEFLQADGLADTILATLQ